jgi:hypothetical protein
VAAAVGAGGARQWNVWSRWRSRLAGELRRLRVEWRGSALWALRITVAATSSYLVGTFIFPGTQPLLAPLTAMLVVQVTPVSLLASGLDRVVAVVTGVSLAVGFAALVPLQWWSLGLLIFVSIAIGQVLRLRANLIEVAISGMLVLGVGALGAEAAAGQRIAETLVGAAIGIAANLLFPPRIPTADAGRAIDGLADAVSALLGRAADELEERASHPRSVAAVATDWLGAARQITHRDVPRVGATLLQAEQGRRLNVRAVGTADLGPGLRHGLESLEHTAVTIRSMFRALVDGTSEGTWLGGEDARDVLAGVVHVLRDLSAAIEAFGQLVRLDAAPAWQAEAADFASLRAAMEGLAARRAELGVLVEADTDAQLRELHTALLSTVKRVQGELDLDQRVRRQLQLRRPARPRPAPLRHVAAKRRPPLGPETTPDADTMPMPRQGQEPEPPDVP